MNEPSRTLAIGANQVFVFADRASACLSVADLIAATIRANLADRGKSILGLATGATPVPIYARLVELHRSTGLSFAGVSTFNLDEYYPMSPLDPRSYRAYMHRNLFEHVDLRPNRAHVLDGTVPLAFAGAHASDFDRWIAADGGLDMQLLGIGRNGHIGFNEPIAGDDAARAMALPTRLVELHPTTVADAARDFGGEGHVPRHALTMGIAPILASRSILVAAFGPNKADAVARSLLGPITPAVPGSLLQSVAARVTWFLDQPAASGLH